MSYFIIFSVLMGFFSSIFSMFYFRSPDTNKAVCYWPWKWRPVDLHKSYVALGTVQPFRAYDCVLFFGLKLSLRNGLINNRFKRLTKPN